MVSALVFGGFKLIYIYTYICMCIHVEQSFPLIKDQPCACCIFNMSMFCFPKPNSAPLSCPSICFLFPSSVSLSCLLSKDFQLHYFQSQGRQLGANSNGKQHQNHLLFLSFFLNSFFPCMWKGECFDRKNYKAFENKVNHCGRMPGVDKWREGNVSTT